MLITQVVVDETDNKGEPGKNPDGFNPGPPIEVYTMSASATCCKTQQVASPRFLGTIALGFTGETTRPRPPRRPSFLLTGNLNDLCWVVKGPYFYPRAQEIEAIKQKLESGYPLALIGMAGVGKSAIAIKLGIEYQNANPAFDIFFIEASTEEGIQKSFVAIADKLKLPRANNQKPEDTVKQVHLWLREKPNSLLVFDNLADFGLYKRYRPVIYQGKLLITTSLGSNWPYHALKIEKLNRSDSVEFLLKRAEITAPTDEDKKSALQLVQELDGLPLALEQAGAYIAENDLTVEEYLQGYQDNKAQLLNTASRHGSKHATVLQTFQTQFQALAEKSPVGAELLKILAFFGPAPIPEKIFEIGGQFLTDKLRAAIGDELDWNDVCSQAASYLLSERDYTANAFKVHRLVQVVVRASMTKDEQQEYLARVVNMVATALQLNVSESPQLAKFGHQVSAHVETLGSHIKEYGISGKHPIILLS
jgi:NB-ARC domain